MEPAVLLPIIAFIALAAGLAVVLRGTGRIVARTRELEGFRAGVKDLAARVDISLDGASGQIDAVRRNQIPPGAVAETILAASDAVQRYTDEARALPGPRKGLAIRAEIVGELERAERALSMVEHGTTILATSRRGPRELEAQTSIKRGHLNLIHAREAINRHALEVAALEVDDRGRTTGRDHTI